MLVVETIAKIRRAFFVQKKPIKTICRELRVSRKVVRKVIRSQATEFQRHAWASTFVHKGAQQRPRRSLGKPQATAGTASLTVSSWPTVSLPKSTGTNAPIASLRASLEPLGTEMSTPNVSSVPA